MLRGSTSPLLRMAASIALMHHERWDGSGYPGGLSGEQIPLSARVCALADVYDALTTARSYKQQPMDDENAFDLIQRSAGSLFDPKVVDAFIAKYPDLLRIKNSSAD
jgi:putative two-component system response regulator